MFLEAGGNVRTEFEDPDGFVYPVRTMVEEGSLYIKVGERPFVVPLYKTHLVGHEVECLTVTFPVLYSISPC